jgi:hypothetical protein
MKGILIAAILCIAGLLAGCTMSESAQERDQRIKQQWALQMRMMVEDIDAVLLLDRSSTLSQWDTYVGN